MNCEDCKDKKCLKTGKPCKAIEEQMRKEGIYSRNYIRPEVSKEKRRDGKGRYREIPFTTVKFDPKRYDGENFR